MRQQNRRYQAPIRNTSWARLILSSEQSKYGALLRQLALRELHRANQPHEQCGLCQAEKQVAA